MIQRKRIRKFESSVKLANQKDNSTYISIFPLQKSTAYLNDGNLQENKPISFEDEQLVDHFRSMIKQQRVGKHEVDKYFASVLTRHKENTQGLVSTTFLDNYNLESQDLVEVCEQKSFKLMSYYNYLHDEEVQKSKAKIQRRNQNLQQQLLRQKQKQMASEEAQKWEHHTQLGRAKQEEQVLDPVHIKFEEKIVNFNPKQKERMEISRVSNYRRMNW